MNLFVFAIGAQVVEATGVRFGREAGFHPGKVLADAQAFGFPKPKHIIIKTKLEEAPDLVGTVWSDLASNIPWRSGGRSKCKRMVCCHGP